MKSCTKCGETKPADAFYSNKRAQCKACEKAAALRRYHADDGDREKRKAAAQKATAKRRSRPRGWADNVINGCRVRANARGKPFGISRQDLLLMRDEQQNCACCGCDLVYGAVGQPTRNSASVDCVIPDLGYILGNIKIICFLCNSMKRDVTDPARFRAIADYIETNELEARLT